MRENNYFLSKISEHISLLLNMIKVLKSHGKFRPVCAFVTQIFCCKSSYLWLHPFLSVFTQGVLNLSSFVIKGTMFDDIANELNARMRIDRYDLNDVA